MVGGSARAVQREPERRDRQGWAAAVGEGSKSAGKNANLGDMNRKWSTALEKNPVIEEGAQGARRTSLTVNHQTGAK